MLKQKIQGLTPSIKKEINQKVGEFSRKKISDKERFLELCFCLLVANCSLDRTKKNWENNKDLFVKASQKEVAGKLKKLGQRFHNNKALYIVLARKHFNKLNKYLKDKKEFELREFLVKEIKGLGYKEASHFLRNQGYKNFAILDRHVLKTLKENKFIKEIPKTLTKNKYLEIENKLADLAKDLRTTQAHLDLYLFFLDSGRVCQK
jgi:N-glycosylase/DNA lyase